MPDPTDVPSDLLRDRMARVAQLRERLADIAGHAESPDGLIKVTATTEDPLHDLQLHPRALKLLNADLATAIQETAAEARKDLKRQADEAIADTLGGEDQTALGTDPAAARARLQQLNGMMESVGRDATAVFEHLRRQFGA